MFVPTSIQLSGNDDETSALACMVRYALSYRIVASLDYELQCFAASCGGKQVHFSKEIREVRSRNSAKPYLTDLSIKFAIL